MILGKSIELSNNEIAAILNLDYIEKQRNYQIDYHQIRWKIIYLIEDDLDTIVTQTLSYIRNAFKDGIDPLGLLDLSPQTQIAPIIVSSAEESISRYCSDKNLLDLNKDEISYIRTSVCNETLMCYFICEGKVEIIDNDIKCY